MDFSFTEEQQAVEKLAGEIFTDFCEPDKLKLLEQQQCWFDQALWSALADAGLLGLAIPEKY
ncbi:MAG: acyl-CoA/acyl-ACP dehydrogenase, partial [Deltaproteobacteria bacterium]|nr:acyl-CoA/acyl-ACP dehydrogenase [Deltaproteobacteria bacterium]